MSGCQREPDGRLGPRQTLALRNGIHFTTNPPPPRLPASLLVFRPPHDTHPPSFGATSIRSAGGFSGFPYTNPLFFLFLYHRLLSQVGLPSLLPRLALLSRASAPYHARLPRSPPLADNTSKLRTVLGLTSTTSIERRQGRRGGRQVLFTSLLVFSFCSSLFGFFFFLPSLLPSSPLHPSFPRLSRVFQLIPPSPL